MFDEYDDFEVYFEDDGGYPDFDPPDTPEDAGYHLGHDGTYHNEDYFNEEYGGYGNYQALANSDLLDMFGGDIDALRSWLDD